MIETYGLPLDPPEVRVTEWRKVGWGLGEIVGYRLWLARTYKGWFQRHEWMRKDSIIYCEDWINAGNYKDFPKHYKAP